MTLFFLSDENVPPFLFQHLAPAGRRFIKRVRQRFQCIHIGELLAILPAADLRIVIADLLCQLSLCHLPRLARIPKAFPQHPLHRTISLNSQ